jgi:PAS domain S-box-containing protein
MDKETSILARPRGTTGQAWGEAELQGWESQATQGRSDMERFFDLTPDLLCIADFEGYFQRVNASFTRALGYSPEELVSRPFITFVHADDVASTLAETHRLIAGEPCVFFANRYRTKDYGWRWLQWNAIPSLEDRLIYAAARDITDQLLAQEGVANRASRERALLNHAGAAIYIKDRAGRYEFVNQEFERLFRVSARQVVGHSDVELVAKGLRRIALRSDEEVWARGETIRSEEILWDGDVPRTFISVRFPLHDSRDDMYATAGIATDITERLRASITDHELDTARAIQQRLYPSHVPTVPGLDIAGRCVAVDRMCGDCMDYVPGGMGEIVFVVGDAAGHGLGPAIEMVQVRSLLRVLLRQHDLADGLTQLRKLTLEELKDLGFVTLLLGRFSSSLDQFHYVGAGHDAWIVHADQTVTYLDSTTTPLGIEDEPACEQVVPVASGDILLLMTDGVAEAGASRGDCFRVERALDVVKQLQYAPASQILEEMLRAVQAHAGPDLTDDVTLVVVKVV